MGRFTSGLIISQRSCHFASFFEDDCIMYCIVWIGSPGEWSVVLSEHCGHCHVFCTFEMVHNENSCISSPYASSISSFCQIADTWDLTVHIVGMCGSSSKGFLFLAPVPNWLPMGMCMDDIPPYPGNLCRVPDVLPYQKTDLSCLPRGFLPGLQQPCHLLSFCA